MKTLLALHLLVMLASCGTGPEDARPCHGYGCEYDLSAPDGLRLRNDLPTIDLTQTGLDLLVDQPYQVVEACAQVLTGGPLVVAVPDGSLGKYAGFTYFDDGLVLIADSYIHSGNQAQSVLRHEYVHYLLAASGFPNDQNANHESPLFLRCAGM